MYDDDYDNSDNFDIDHVSQSSCDHEMEQELTSTNAEDADFDQVTKKTAIWVCIWLVEMVCNGHTTKWNNPI